MVSRLRFYVRSHACIAVLAAIFATMGLASAAGASQGAHGARHAGYQRGRIHHVVGKGGPASGHPGIGHGPGSSRQSSYLALGDSLAFGYSQAKFESLLPSEPASAYNTGYVDDFAHLLKLGNPKLEVINDGCPGETTESFIKGPCEYQLAYPLHHPYVGGPTSSQLSDALTYLQANPNTNPITLDIGANDALGVIEHTCEKKVECVIKEAPALFAHIAANLGLILADLRGADPHATIIVLGLYNPFGEKLPGGNALTAQLNEVMEKVASAVGARFADPLPIFNPPGALEEPTICLLTNMCKTPEDIHPTDLGYGVLAGLIAKEYYF
ncbi:MAG: SGNH/GDSL hydrolase family protein [Solirubrobacteraceae bacterium]